MKRALIGAAAAAVLLAGCSSGSSGDPTPAPTSSGAASASATPAQVMGPMTGAEQILADAVAKIGCTDFYLGTPAAPAADAWGPCLIGESSVTLYVVSTPSAETSLFTLITNLGMSESQVIKAPSLLVAVDNPDQVEQVRAALGGS